MFLIILVGLQQPASLEVLFKNSAAKTVWVLLLFITRELSMTRTNLIGLRKITLKHPMKIKSLGR